MRKWCTVCARWGHTWVHCASRYGRCPAGCRKPGGMSDEQWRDPWYRR